MLGKTDISIKRFFLTSIKKGLRNFNLYNTQLRNPKKYRVYKEDLIDKIISVHSEKKSKYLLILN